MKEILIFAGLCFGIILIYNRKEKPKKNDNTASAPIYPNPTGANRGLKNNNPGNIRKNSDTFFNEIIPSGDPAFKQFKTMEAGIRAIFVILNTYKSKYGINTIGGIINRWSPRSDGNNTDLYITNVEKWTGINRQKALTENDYKKVVKAIIKQETGANFTDAQIEKGFLMVRILV